jgi:MtN3 and saliva related transmembrane protein
LDLDAVARPGRSLEQAMKIMYLGLLAGALTTSSAFPQLIKSYRTRSTADLSLWFLIAILAGVTLWIGYGIAMSDIPLIVANSISFLPLSCTLYLKIKWDVVNRPLAPK